MTHARADAGRDKAVVMTAGANFGEASELRPTEVRSSAGIDNDADSKEQCGRNPTPRRGVDGHAPPRARECAGAGPDQNPGWNEHTKRRALALAPNVGPGVHNHPEQRDGRVDDAGQPSHGAEKVHQPILQSWVMERNSKGSVVTCLIAHPPM